jgi:hypothetical protein
MYTIDGTYFVRELYIPNASGNDMDRSGAQGEREQYIDGMSRLVYKSALGLELFQEFDSDPNIIDGIPNTNAPTKWQNLVNGTSYRYSGEDYRWEGMISQEGTFKTSLLAYYTFYRFLYDNDSTMTGTGNKVINTKNTTIVNNTQHLTTVWNEFVKMYRGNCMNHNYYNNKAVVYNYKGVPFYDYFGNENNNYVDLITFLTHNESNYQNAAKSLYINQEPIIYKNQLGL